MSSLPPLLPQTEIINSYDIYTSTNNTAFEVLLHLQRVIVENLKGDLVKPYYNTIPVLCNEITDNASDFYIDIPNFSLEAKICVQDLDIVGLAEDANHIGISMYYDENCKHNLVKFRGISGERRQFSKIVSNLSYKAGQYLTGLNSKAILKPYFELSDDKHLLFIYGYIRYLGQSIHLYIPIEIADIIAEWTPKQDVQFMPLYNKCFPKR
eukprot:366129_1